MISEETKGSIDKMTYRSMLELWRNAPVGHPMFHGETGDYYKKVMMQKESGIPAEDRVAISKAIGWSKVLGFDKK